MPILSRRALNPWRGMRKSCPAEHRRPYEDIIADGNVVLQLLLSWRWTDLAHDGGMIKPKHRAAQIAADVAANGNPSGV